MSESTRRPTAQLFAVLVNRDDTVRVVARDVQKTTPHFYYIDKRERANDDWDVHRAFGWSTRIEKSAAHVTARAALEAYMAKRQRDKANAKAVIAQATKQIASANEALAKAGGGS